MTTGARMLLRTASLLLAILVAPCSAWAQGGGLDAALAAVLRLEAEVPPDSRSAATLGGQREGNAIVIDGGGLVLTIGYLIVEAQTVTLHRKDGRRIPADVVGYDYDTGFGLVRALAPLDVQPIPLGRSQDVQVGEKVLAIGHGGAADAVAAVIVSKREFAGYWEYLLDQALYTSPPHQNWGGTALVDQRGSLVGVGSLFIGDAAGDGRGRPGNLFVPIDLLKPILSDLLIDGRSANPDRPWIGITVNGEVGGHPVLTRLTKGGPAEKAGLLPGDIIIGVQDKKISTPAQLYRSMWALGDAGVRVNLKVVRGNDLKEVEIQSVSRYDFLKLRRTY